MVTAAFYPLGGKELCVEQLRLFMHISDLILLLQPAKNVKRRRLSILNFIQNVDVDILLDG